ncbi:hypothetical protein C1J03_14695 [Sulfitobacter sp. SK012]|nr:hypothetical protein C1J03_14695 [Sulfitobacter sp. SK012]
MTRINVSVQRAAAMQENGFTPYGSAREKLGSLNRVAVPTPDTSLIRKTPAAIRQRGFVFLSIVE